MKPLKAERQSRSGAVPLPPATPGGAPPGHTSWSGRIAGQFGGKRAFFRHHQARILYQLGVFRGLLRIDWSRVQRVIFVCHGNICRSPYCEARGRLLGLRTVSFGLAAETGKPANAALAALALLRGVDLAAHRSRTVLELDLCHHDLLVAMEPSHALQLNRLRLAGAQLTLLGLWSTTPRPYVHDPNGLGQDYMAQCLDILDQGVRRIAAEVRAYHAA